MLASATEVEVELNVPDDVTTFFGVTWAQDPHKDQIFIKAFPRGSDGRSGLLESSGLVEVGDCLTAINGVPLGRPGGLREVTAGIRAAGSPLSLRFARYPPRHAVRSSSSPALTSFPPVPPPSPAVPAWASAAAGVVGRVLSPTAAGSRRGGTAGGGGGGGGGGLSGSLDNDVGEREREAGGGGREKGETAVDYPELDDVLNSALVLGLGERVADIQKRNARLLQEVDRIGRAAADKRQGVERVASAAASLTAAGTSLLAHRALPLLSAARQDAAALCGTMARLDELLAARERAQAARRRALVRENGRGPPGGLSSSGGRGGLCRGGDGDDDSGGGGGGGGDDRGLGASGGNSGELGGQEARRR